jgi:hypothetical protein
MMEASGMKRPGTAHMKYNDGRLANRLAPGLARLSSPCGRNAPPARLSCRQWCFCRQRN